MIGKAITDILTASPGITAMVGDRIYPMSSNAQGLPSIYYKVGLRPHQNKNGQQGQEWTVEILTMCKTYDDAWNLAKLIKTALLYQRRRTVGNVKFIEIELIAVNDDYEFNISSAGNISNYEIKTNNLI